MPGSGVTVAKFGGTSLCDSTAIRHATNIVRSDMSRRSIVVSAPGKRNTDDRKITDLMMEWARTGSREDSTHLRMVVDRFREIRDGLSLHDFDLDAKIAQMCKEAAKLRAMPLSTQLEFAMSRGEWLNAQIIARDLDFQFIDAASFISFGDSGYHAKATAVRAKRAHVRVDGVLGAVVPGFYGAAAGGLIRTFPRGGSDITGAIVAALVEAEVYENWTDVPGVLAADPRIVKNPRKIDVMTYAEARELTFMGASVLQQEAVRPAWEAGIPIHVRETANPRRSGTMIVRSLEGAPRHRITGISGKTGCSVVTISKYGMDDETGFLAKAASVFGRAGVSVHNCPGSVDTLSFIVYGEAFRRDRANIVKTLKRVCKTDDVEVLTGITIVCTVGAGMRHTTGIAAKLMGALGRAGINIVTINQGSSENNIEVGVVDTDGPAAIRAIYNALAR